MNNDYKKFYDLAAERFRSSSELKMQMLTGNYIDILLEMAQKIVHSFEQGGKLLICGNGGSAADAQHLAAELLIRLRSSVNRQPLPAIALAMDSSTLTACGNDYGYDCLYERMVAALAKPQDILWGITTSGKSENVVRALKQAQAMGIHTLAFLGSDGGVAKNLSDVTLVVPSHDTGHIQEVHITAGHILIELIEEMMQERGSLIASSKEKNISEKVYNRENV